MIKINLLPEKDQPQKRKNYSLPMIKINKKLLVPISGGLTTVIILFLLLILIYPPWQNLTLAKLEKKWQKIGADYSKAKTIKEEQKTINKLFKNIGEISQKRVLWAAKLNDISDSLPQEAQLTELRTITEEGKNKSIKKGLLISGIVPALPGEQVVSDFAQNLEGTPDFKKDFPEITPPSTQMVSGDIKIFTIKCFMAENDK